MSSLTLSMTCPWFGVFDTNIPDLPQCPKTWVGSHLSWKVKLNTFNGFLFMTLLTSCVCNFSLELLLGLNRAWANLIRYVSWRMCITFFLSLTEHWVQNYSESLKILTFFLNFLGDEFTKHWWKYEDFRKSSYIYLCIHLQLYLCIK